MPDNDHERIFDKLEKLGEVINEVATSLTAIKEVSNERVKRFELEKGRLDVKIDEKHVEALEKIKEQRDDLNAMAQSLREQFLATVQGIDKKLEKVTGSIEQNEKAIREIKTWRTTILGKISGMALLGGVIIAVIVWGVNIYLKARV